MALTVNHPVSEIMITSYTPGIGSTPSVANFRAPFRGKILKVGLNQSAAVTGTTTVTTAIAGTSITGGAITVTAGGAGTHFTATPTALNLVNEDDLVTFTPAGGTGAGVTANCYAVFRRT